MLDKVRQLVPQLREEVYGKPLVYLDNAATSLRPVTVVGKWEEMSLKYNANLHRAVHYMADKATGEYEKARASISDYINAGNCGKVIFTSGATAAINLVAFCFSELAIGEGDEIIVAQSEHHSDIVPWQMVCERKGAKLVVLPVDDSGQLRLDLLEGLIVEGKTKIVCVAHISNVLGIINPIKEIVNICHSKNCAVLADGAQGIVHTVPDMEDLGCDFYAFSGHKVYAAPGTGVLFVRNEWADRMPPYMGGGEMIESVSWAGTSYAKAPLKFEAGTQNISGTPTLVPALEFAGMLRKEEIEESYGKIKSFVFDALKSDRRIKLYGNPSDPEKKIPLFSISVEGVHHEDMALLLDKMGIAVRSGHMCAEPLMTRFGVTGMLRVSFAPYNTLEEAEFFIRSLDKVIKMLV